MFGFMEQSPPDQDNFETCQQWSTMHNNEFYIQMIQLYTVYRYINNFKHIYISSPIYILKHCILHRKSRDIAMLPWASHAPQHVAPSRRGSNSSFSPHDYQTQGSNLQKNGIEPHLTNADSDLDMSNK